jgi:hypothetical protein
MIASTSSLRLVDELVGLRRLLGDGVDGMLEDSPLTPRHWRMVGERQDDVGAPAWPVSPRWRAMASGSLGSIHRRRPSRPRGFRCPTRGT